MLILQFSFTLLSYHIILNALYHPNATYLNKVHRQMLLSNEHFFSKNGVNRDFYLVVSTRTEHLEHANCFLVCIDSMRALRDTSCRFKQ